MSAMGILLPCDGSEPLPISVFDGDQLRSLVGGYFDAVTINFGDELLDFMGVPNDTVGFVAVGYINDTGMIDGMPVNVMASIMFGRDLYGPVVVVSGTNPDTKDYDGENHDVPSWFCDRVFDGSLRDVSNMTTEVATITAEAIKYCVITGFYSRDEFNQIMAMMRNVTDENVAIIEEFVQCAFEYYIGAIESEHGSVADGAEAFLAETNGGL